MNDSLLDYVGGNAKKGQFYSVEKSTYDYTNEYRGIMLACTFVLDSTEDYYERKVYNFFDLTGQIGGLYEILAIIGEIFVAFFAEKILMLSLISNLYQVEDANEVSKAALLVQNIKTSKVKPINSKIEEDKLPDINKKSHYADSGIDQQYVDIDERRKIK
jgi:hypothetical protein